MELERVIPNNTAFLGEFCCQEDDLLTFLSDPGRLSGLVGYNGEEIRQTLHASLLYLVDEPYRKEIRERIRILMSTGGGTLLDVPLRRKDGSVVFVLCRFAECREADRCYICGFFAECTLTGGIYREVEQTLERYRIILSQPGNVVFEWNLQEDTMYFSDGFQKMFGYGPLTTEFSERIAANNHVHPDDSDRLCQQIERMRTGESYQALEIRIAQQTGEWLWCKIRATGLYDGTGNLSWVVGVILDVNEEKMAVNAWQKQAEQDFLTKLFNARATRKFVEEYLAVQPTAPCAMLVLDLDDFKKINDLWGHPCGDEVLVCTGRVLQRFFRSRDVVGRVGGDEFVVLMKNVSDTEKVKERCGQLIRTLCEKSYDKAKDFVVTCSIGVAMSPDCGTDYDTLFACADAALYEAKSSGKNCFAVYEKSSSQSR